VGACSPQGHGQRARFVGFSFSHAALVQYFRLRPATFAGAPVFDSQSRAPSSWLPLSLRAHRRGLRLAGCGCGSWAALRGGAGPARWTRGAGDPVCVFRFPAAEGTVHACFVLKKQLLFADCGTGSVWSKVGSRETLTHTKHTHVSRVNVYVTTATVPTLRPRVSGGGNTLTHRQCATLRHCS
jgi:hypothetical protein